MIIFINTLKYYKKNKMTHKRNFKKILLKKIDQTLKKFLLKDKDKEEGFSFESELIDVYEYDEK